MQTRNSTQLLTDRIVEWMIEHPNQFVPEYKEISLGLDLCRSMITCFAKCKKNAFQELHRRGYKLEYIHSANTFNAKIISGPTDSKISDELPVEQHEESNEDKQKIISLAQKGNPPAFLLLNQSLKAVNLLTVSDMISGLANVLQNDVLLDVKIKITAITSDGGKRYG